MITITALAAAAAMANATPANWTHTVPVAHRDMAATATYQARPRVTTRQIGMSAGPRMSTVRCVWTADIEVERQLTATGSEASGLRTLPSAKSISGQRHGDCTANRRAIDRDIAARTPEIQAHLLAVAEQDQRELRSEVDVLAAPIG
jgi:hypothetical protein